MRIEYFIELEDHIQFNHFHAKNSKTMSRIYLCMRFGPIVLAFFDLLRASHLSLVARIVDFLFYSALWILIFSLSKWFFSNIVTRKMLKEGRNRSVLGRHEVVLEESEVIERTSLNEMHTNWAGVEQVVENERYIFIYITASAAHVIPKRAFATQEDARSFFQTAKDYQGRAQGLPQYCGAPASVISR